MLHLHFLLVTAISIVVGSLVFHAVAKILILGEAEIDYEKKRRELAELKFEDLKERRLGGVAYQVKEAA